jgi:hypothetical protein
MVSQYELSDQQLSNFAALNVHIFKDHIHGERISVVEMNVGAGKMRRRLESCDIVISM